MDFILSESNENTTNLVLSDEDFEENEADLSFIDDSIFDQESENFYRDPKNLSHYSRFHNQTRDPIEATYSDISE